MACAQNKCVRYPMHESAMQLGTALCVYFIYYSSYPTDFGSMYLPCSFRRTRGTLHGSNPTSRRGAPLQPYLKGSTHYEVGEYLRNLNSCITVWQVPISLSPLDAPDYFLVRFGLPFESRLVLPPYPRQPVRCMFN